jgi:hypothetical protein
VKDAHSLKDCVPRIDDARNYTPWKTVGRWPSTVLEIRKEDLQDELIRDDCEFATLGLKIRGGGNFGRWSSLGIVGVKAKHLGELRQPILNFRLELFGTLN